MMAYADPSGAVFEHPELEMAGWDGDCWRTLEDDEIIPLPEGSDLFVLPGRRPAGYDPVAEEMVVLDDPEVFAASCFIAPAWLRTLLPAYETLQDAPALPLFAYSVLGVRDGELVTSGIRVDPDIRQDPFRFDIAAVEAGVKKRLEAEPENRLVAHLTRCALEYHCRAAQNYFLERFEAPMPAAPTCNALCVGCISLQPKGGDEWFVASHDRIRFPPTPQELADVAAGHIARVGADAVVSFGQGCEGEPLMQGDQLTEAIREIRRRTQDGVINLNSNASRPRVVEAMCKAGLQSIRVSTNSARAEVYSAYYRPKGYTFDDVRESARIVKAHGGYVMLNYFIFPGVTDDAAELDALSAWIDELPIDMLQLRNLNMDPEIYLAHVGAAAASGEPMGIRPWLAEVRRRHPRIRFGYFNPPRRLFDEAPEAIALT
ncbi:MAG: radical SAM protein [Deltaproteobacteria bacterium]|nr:radical SAM protein [Deltaproteobacteria bacterium]MCB9788749.1 radical SAM protein [Deltaproteobacteria bacterium]